MTDASPESGPDPGIVGLLEALQGSGKDLETLGALADYRREALNVAALPDATERIAEARDRLRERLRTLVER